MNAMLDQFDKDGAMLDQYEPTEIKGWTSTGNLLLNAHISGSLLKGVPDGRMFLISGDPKTGKSYLTMNVIRNWQERGFFVWIFETENSHDKARFESQGIDPSGVRVTQPETPVQIIEMLSPFTEELLKQKRTKKNFEPPKIAIAIDSLTNLLSHSQLSNMAKGEYKQDRGSVIQEVNILLNMLSIRLGKLDIPFIATQHTKKEQFQMGSRTFESTKPKGGSGSVFMGSQIIVLTKKDARDEEDKSNKIGVKVSSDLFESRFARKRKIEFHILFERGMNQFEGLRDFVSWDTCGIDHGKWEEYTDPAYYLTLKKQCTVEDLETLSFDWDVLMSVLGKEKQKTLHFHLEEAVEKGYIKNEEGEMSFTKKTLKQIKDGKYEPLKFMVPVRNDKSPNMISKRIEGKTFHPDKLYNPRILTPEVIQELDEKVIRPFFEFGHGVEDTEDEDDGFEDGITPDDKMQALIQGM